MYILQSPHAMDPPIPGMVSRDIAWFAHDQNNFLQVALVKLDLLREAIEVDSDPLEKLLDLQGVLEDMGPANRAILTVFRTSQAELVDPGEIILNTTELVRSLDRNTVTLEVLSLPMDSRVPILSAHLQQVLFNILKNALEAVPEVGGRIVVAASLKEREHVHARLRRSSRKALHITVEDNGNGISPSLRRRLMHGPSTTKPDGHGLGVGHARKLLGLYGGTLRFERLEGHGTRVRIIWPF